MRLEQKALDHAAECLELSKKLIDEIKLHKELIKLQKELIDNLQEQNEILKKQVISLGDAIWPRG